MMTSNGFTKESLPQAVRKLFELNQYIVEGPRQIHGAEVDLVARQKGNPFAPPIYIEVTIEYVDNDKYGKDVGKLAMVREIDRDCQLLIVSARGFSIPVKERAEKTRIRTLTYQELFASFEQFDPYIEAVIRADTPLSRELTALSSIYEEPLFADQLGQERATDFLNSWRETSDPKKRWLVVLGEYGTGKTALTRILQYRWLLEYQHNPSIPIPFRIELRDFTRQFDARGLIHHFLDHNHLAHIPIEFVLSLIRTGRIVLLLDGYDEMAQYLHARERRTCLEALAQLAADGARGILTSRPNYFTEDEELHVFEVLYSSLRQGKYHLGVSERALIEQEGAIDQLLGQFLDRFERTLRDLEPEQTEALVDRALADDPAGRDAVRRILRRVFRTGDDGAAISLSGKPVIVTYLLEVVEGLKDAGKTPSSTDAELTEWQVYKLIMDLLMLRDLKRSGLIAPDDRRSFLHSLSMILSQKDKPVILEDEFKDLVGKMFSVQLRRAGASRHDELERLFADLRSSATLTRSEGAGRSGWRFSHNSLREFLLAEHLLHRLQASEIPNEPVPITDAMRLFAASLSSSELAELARRLAGAWAQRSTNSGVGQLVTLLWDGLLSRHSGDEHPSRSCLAQITGIPIALNRVTLTRIELSSATEINDFSSINCADSEFYEVDFSGAVLREATFSGSVLENVRFVGSDLSSANMSHVLAFDIDISSALLDKADFRGVGKGDISVVISDPDAPTGRRRIEGIDALGYVSKQGAITDPIPVEAVLRHHLKYPIVHKVLEQLGEQTLHQRRGIEQRGAAAKDVPFARLLVQQLLNQGFLTVPKARRELLETTEMGRGAFKRFAESGELPEPVVDLMIRNGG